MIKVTTKGIIRNTNLSYTSRYGDLILHHSAFPDNSKIMYRFGE